MNGIENWMEDLRKQLNKLMKDIDSYDREKVLQISQELDEVICNYIKSNNTR